MVASVVPVVAAHASRTMDALFLNTVANHPDVRPTIGGDGPIDLTTVLDDPDNLAFETPNGGLVCLALGSGRYDVHSLFLPEGRGAEASQAMREVAAYMFGATDCTEGRTTVPLTHRGAALVARRAGFATLFTRPLPWTGGTAVGAEFLGLSIDRWALGSDQTAALGAWFHEQLSAAKVAHGSAAPVHDDDPVHDHMVGAVVLMLHGGQPEKAVRFYNVWAQCTHYAPIALLRRHPIVLDVQDAIVEARATTMEVLRCR